MSRDRIRRLFHDGVRVARGSILAGGGGTAFLLATAALNVSNFLFNVIASRLLGPSAYGALGSLLGLVTVVTVVFGALTAGVAQTIADQARPPVPGDLAPSRATSWGMAFGFTAIVVLALPIGHLLHLASVWPVLILSIFLPLSVAQIVPRGALLGRLQFRTLSVALAASAVTRLCAGALLMEAGLGLDGAVLATVLGQLVVSALIVWPVRGEMRSTPTTSPVKVPLRDASLALIALGGFSVLNVVDSVLARFYLPAAESGYYVAASTAAQIVFVLSAAVGVLAFPRFVTAARQGHGHRVLIEGVVVVGALGVLPAAILTAFPHEIVSVLFGPRYSPAAGTLQILAWEGVALGLISILVYFHLGHRNLVSCASWLGVVGATALVTGAVHGSSCSIAVVMLCMSCVTALIMATAVLWPAITLSTRRTYAPLVVIAQRLGRSRSLLALIGSFAPSDPLGRERRAWRRHLPMATWR
jgi:O-antigen/teichoic acid export membrane protein